MNLLEQLTTCRLHILSRLNSLWRRNCGHLKIECVTQSFVLRSPARLAIAAPADEATERGLVQERAPPVFEEVRLVF